MVFANGASGATDELAHVAVELQRSLLAVSGRGHGLGSGLALADDLVVTNDHVARDDEVQVTDSADRTLTASVVSRFEEADLALLRVSDGGFAPATLRSSPPVRPGELVIAVGNPHGNRRVVTFGNVVAAPRRAGPDSGPILGAIVADVRLAPGNSGGPLADARGHVLGINAMVSGGRAVAVPSASVERLLAEAASAGPRGFLGVTGVVVPGPASELDALLVSAVEPDGPAEVAGVLLGDLIVGVGESAWLAPVERQLRRMRVGESIEVEVLRGGRPQSLTAIPRAA